jgi:hypothetical protein
MTNATAFGDEVIAEAQKLKAAGFDANQIAGALCKKDPAGKNYGIGIILGGNGKPAPTSATLLDYLRREVEESCSGSYLNSDAMKKELLEAVLRWQAVPEKYWANFLLLTPSDAGTGAVQTAIQAAGLLKDGLTTLAAEELSWPAYKTLAASQRLKFSEFASDGVAQGAGVLPIYQPGPLNTTGRVPSPDMVRARVSAAKESGAPVILDRAYSGFEYARELGALSYADLMKKSFAQQIEPFLSAGVPIGLAVSPTKAFVTFSLRPCGLLLVYLPENNPQISQKLTGLIRARGSSFEHPVSRAFIKALVKARPQLEAEHAEALKRVAQAELAWEKLAQGTPIAKLFSPDYAGLFRNPKATPDAARDIYGAHMYPVFADGRCRLNVTGLPSDEATAKEHVAFFAKYCL